MALTANVTDRTVSVIDIPTLKATSTAIPVGYNPQHIAITSDGQTAVVVNQGDLSVQFL